MGMKRDQDTGRKDSLGRPIKVAAGTGVTAGAADAVRSAAGGALVRSGKSDCLTAGQVRTIDGLHNLGDGVKLIVRGGGLAAGGDEDWYLNGKLHRVDGPALQWMGGVAAGGHEAWHLNGKRHRVDGPAFQWAGGVAAGGHEEWCLNGELHRDPSDGPAVSGGAGGESWFVRGVEYPDQASAVAAWEAL